MSFRNDSRSGSTERRSIAGCLALLVGLGAWATDAQAAAAKGKSEHAAGHHTPAHHSVHERATGALVDQAFLKSLRTRFGAPDSSWPDAETPQDAVQDRTLRRLAGNRWALQRQLQFLETYPRTHRMGPRARLEFLRRQRLVQAELNNVDERLEAAGVPEIDAGGVTSAVAAATLGVLILGGRRRAAVCPS